MKAVSCRYFAAVAGALMFLGVAGAAHALVIDFSGETPGSRPNGFSPVGFPDVSFTDSVGADLVIEDSGVQSDGIGLVVNSDTDGGGLFIDFAIDITSIALDFGNDDPDFTNPGDLALLQVFHDGNFIAGTTVVLNRDDIMNQRISLFAPLIDRAFFAYVDPNLVPLTGLPNASTGLIEIVDNISVSPVPLPAALPLFLAALSALGFCGWRRRRMA